MSKKNFLDFPEPDTNQSLQELNKHKLFPFSEELKEINTLKSSRPYPATQQVEVLNRRTLSIETQPPLVLKAFHDTTTKESVKIGQLLHQILALKAKNSDLLARIDKLQLELAKNTETLLESTQKCENYEKKLRIVEKNNSELSTSLSKSKVRVIQKLEQDLNARISNLVEENQKNCQLNEKMQRIIRENVSQETLRLQEENQVLKKSYKSLEDHCKAANSSQNPWKIIENNHFTNELQAHLKSVESENLNLKQQLFHYLNPSN